MKIYEKTRKFKNASDLEQLDSATEMKMDDGLWVNPNGARHQRPQQALIFFI